MKIFVTGATGFVGTHFLQQALEAGHEVVAQRRPGSQTRLPLDKHPVWVDGSLDEDYRSVMDGCDVFVHLASHTPNPPYAPLDECLYWNVYSAVKLARQAAEAGISNFLIAGSCFEYGLSAGMSDYVDKSTPLLPTLSYPISKAAASIAFEGFARENVIKLKLLRIFQVYGNGEGPTRFWPSLRQAALAGKDFPMSEGQQLRDFVSVESVAQQFVEHLDFSRVELGAPEIHLIASGKPQTLLAFAEYWWKKWCASGQLKPGKIPYRDGEIMRLVPIPDSVSND